MKSIYSIILLSLSLMANTHAMDKGKEEFKKSEHKEYDITKDGKVVLSNKYGNIDVRTNNGTKVVIDVEIVVNAKNAEVADEAFERILINFESKSDYVKAATSIESQKSSWWGWNNKSFDFKINYSISVPKTVMMNVYNKYGNVYITELENDLDLEIKYGNFTVEKAANLKLIGKYGVGEIKSCNNIDAELGYFSGSGFEVGSCGNVEIDSKYSAVRIGSAKKINADTGYDNYKIGTAESLRFDGNYNKLNIDEVSELIVDARYTNIDIDDLKISGDFDLGYGSLDIYNVAKGFKDITVEGDYTSIKMNIADGASYKVNLDAKYAGIEVPDNIEIKLRDYDGNSKHLEGTVGSNPTGNITVDSGYGGIKIRQ